jgi:hypothetical protein
MRSSSPDTPLPPDEGITNYLIHYWAFNIIPFGRLFVDKIRRNHFTRYGTYIILSKKVLTSIMTSNAPGRTPISLSHDDEYPPFLGGIQFSLTNADN